MDNKSEIGVGDDKHFASDLPNSEVLLPGNQEEGTTTELSLGAVIKGTASRPLTTFEKKAGLINYELDKFGLGRYQLCIWFLCGFGYFLDLAWAQGVGLIATAVYQEMGVASTAYGDIFSCSNAGLAIGALFWGIMVDVIGRKWAFNLTCLITSIFGLLLVSICTIDICAVADHNTPGCAKVQLWSNLCNLSPRLSWPRRQHSD